MGVLSSLSAPKLGAIVIKEAIKRSNITPAMVSEVIMGCVLPAGLGQAPARQASIYAGVPDSVPCLTINKMCGSGLKSVMLAVQAIQCSDSDIVVAGGMESMSNVPYYLDKARNGYRMGNGRVIDGMILDGLWDVYNNYHMGNAAELCSRELKISKTEQDEFATQSYKKALNAIEKGFFKEEIVTIEIKGRKENIIISEDEEPKKVNFDKGLRLKSAFEDNGSVTAFNASKINDGASALVLMSVEKAEELNINPLARVLGHVSHAQQPEWFTTAPAYAITKVLEKTGLNKEDIDLFEANEAFAVQALSVIKIAGLNPDKVNINGGAVALGHPIGASGARILTTLLYNMIHGNAKKGIATLCIGGGEASAIIVEKI
jgi:acetyl-CoA C-acetyltransferase